jgi:hypothetical protein
MILRTLPFIIIIGSVRGQSIGAHGPDWFQGMRRAPIASGAQSPDDIRGLLREFAPEGATQAWSEETSARASLRRTPHPHRH